MRVRNPAAFLSTVGLGPDPLSVYRIAETHETGSPMYYIVSASTGRRVRGPWPSLAAAMRDLASLTGDDMRVSGTPFALTSEERYMRFNPKERFRSARASKRGVRGAAVTQQHLDEHYEQVSHDIAEAREEKLREDRYRRESRMMDAGYPTRDY